MDYARAVVEFFVKRREKGSATSAADEQVLLRWESEGVPVGVVFAGVDQAFARKAEPPKSLSECGRWVRAAHKKWAGGSHIESVLAEGRSVSGSNSQSPDALDSWIDELRERETRGHPALRKAAGEIRRELELLSADDFELGVLTFVDQAVAEAALEQLPEPERGEVLEEAEGALAGRPMSGLAWAGARAREIIRILGK